MVLAVAFMVGAVALASGTGRLILAPVSFGLGRFERSWALWVVVLCLTGLALALILWPTLRFWRSGRVRRIEHVQSLYGTRVIIEYCNRFWAGRSRVLTETDVVPGAEGRKLDYDSLGDLIEACKKPGAGATKELAERYLTAEFKRLVRETYGESNFRGAMVLLSASAAVVLFAAFEHAVMWAVERDSAAKEAAHFLLGIKLDTASVAAIFGAYTWVTSDLIHRYRLADLSSSDLNWYTLRFLVAVPIGFAIAQFGGFKVTDPASQVSETGAVLAFVVSMFSLSRIQEVLGHLINRGTGVSLVDPRQPDAADVVIGLPGIDQRVSDRLASEGVTTIAQIATCDPVRLSARANIPFNLMLEYIDAAILWQMVGDKLLKLREFGWTGASKIIEFAERRARALDRVLDEWKSAHDRVSEAAERLAVARDASEEASAREALAQAQGRLAAAATAVETAVASSSADGIYERIGTAAKMDAAAVQEIVATVCANDYARLFIRELMKVSASQAARPETASNDAAVPKAGAAPRAPVADPLPAGG